MKKIIKGLAVASLIIVPEIASAAATCGRPYLRGNWRVTASLSLVKIGTCDFFVNSQGQISNGNCYAVAVDPTNPTTLRQYQAVLTGSLRLGQGCGISGTMTVTSPTASDTVAVTGWAWSSRNTAPNFATLDATYTIGTVPVFFTMEMTRLLPGTTPVPIAPPL